LKIINANETYLMIRLTTHFIWLYLSKWYKWKKKNGEDFKYEEC